MRSSTAHAATSGSVPFMLRGPKSVRRILAVAVAGAIGFTPAVINSSPAYAAVGDITRVGTGAIEVTEGGRIDIRLSRAGGGPLDEAEVTWAVADGLDPTIDEDDVVAMSGSVIFPAAANATSAQNQTVSIGTVNDTMDEQDLENLEITLTLPSPQSPITVNASIRDNDAPPAYRLVVDDANPDESAPSVMVSATLSAPSGKDIEIPLSTQAGTAKAGANQDFVALDTVTPPVLTILAGALDSDEVPVTINNDDVFEEPVQSFTVRGGTSPTVTGTQSATVNIHDNEDQPEIDVVAAGAANEGDEIDFRVHLSGASERPVTAAWHTDDGPGADYEADPLSPHGRAVAGQDYTGGNGTVTFRAATASDDTTEGNELQHVKVRSTRDTIDELNPEDMHLTLSNPTIGKLAEDFVATGSITDTNVPPEVRLLPTTRSATEGNSGVKAQTFTVRLDKPSGQKVKVQYAVTAGQTNPATPGSDFISRPGTLIFQPGETEKTFTVDIVGDSALETDETFEVEILAANATLATDLNTGPVPFTIRNDDSAPSFSVAPLVLKEGNEGTVAVLPVKLSGATAANATFNVTAAAGTGQGGATDAGANPGDIDYVDPTATVIIPAGQTTGFAYFLVNGDDVFEGDESLSVEVATDTVSGTDLIVTGTPKTAKVTITDDDPAPSVRINSDEADEGDSVQLTATTMGVAQHDVSYNVTARGGSANGSAAAAADDFSDPGTIGLTIDGGTLSGSTVNVGDPIDITDDERPEPAETVLVSGSAFGTAGKVEQGVLTIAANDDGDQGGEGPGEEPGDNRPTISAPGRTGAGPVTITGRVAPDATVELWGAPIGGGELAWIANTKATATGNYSFTRTISQGMRFVAQSQEVNSNEVRVTITQGVTLTASSPRADHVTVLVKSSPNAAGRKVVVQRWTGPNTWTNILVSRANVNGAYTATTTAPSGTIALRAWVEGVPSQGINTGYSAIVRPVIK
ncbi:hypothetical protein Ade02nite_02570 [Paractinoplanes deccanensis]|uniref:Calx-beta domain-containing protein n=1 Tax=Paractinoplanes deccanensis TaxID=113561 RepID=A0ABQ3XV52_9ACTN|nr:Calx-beta domain-containing protein [Actinoplanes deccanensis]GID71616.1 hypothetical protein Ade02nite_02570 [Actinoplanes deccanensis]